MKRERERETGPTDVGIVGTLRQNCVSCTLHVQPALEK